MKTILQNNNKLRKQKTSQEDFECDSLIKF